MDMRYIIRVRLVAANGDEGHTDIPTDERTAVALMDAGCDRFFLYEPITDERTHTVVETYNLSYAHSLAAQRDRAEKTIEDMKAELALTINSLNNAIDALAEKVAK
jgi:hypothetical protein